MTDHDFEAILEDMDFELLKNGSIEYPSSVPAVLEFQSLPVVNVNKLKKNVEKHAFAIHDIRFKDVECGFHFSAKILTDHAKDVVVKANKDHARIYHEGRRPDVYELSRIIHAVETAFETELEHLPNNGEQGIHPGANGNDD
jgi:hypothetical protein